MFIPTHKSYRPLTDSDSGFYSRILVDLNVSESKFFINEDGRRSKQYKSRVYSMKHKVNSSWRLKGHSQRCLIKGISFSVNERLRLQVVEKASKTPHAFIDGQVEQIVLPTDDATHGALIKSLVERGAEYISFNPYLTSGFVSTGREPGLKGKVIGPEHVLSGCKEAYCYEHAVLAIL